MTEQEYIDVSDRVRIGVAKLALLDITATNSSIIDENELKLIVQSLANWEIELFDKMNVEHE